MRLRILCIGVMLGLLIAVSPAGAQVAVTARVDRDTLSAGETVQLEVRISGGGKGAVDLSPLTDFKVHSQSTGSSVQIINGKLTREVVYAYVLTHLRQGKLTIPALTVTVDGQTHQTEPITVTVSASAAGGPADASAQKEIWVTADLSDHSPFAGQQITYTFRLYRAVQIDDARFIQPEFKGFSVQKIEDRRSYRKIINGREHAVTELYFVLTPQDPGKITIEPATLHVGVVRRNHRRRRSPFDDFFNRHIVEPRALMTKSLDITVRPLPATPSDKEFSGLVGRFEMTAEIESTDLTVGDSATLAITIKGDGNIMDAQAPDVAWPKAFKSYADNPQEEINLDRTGARGKKVFRTALVPVEPGEYTFPSIDLVYFDVEQEAYRTLHAQVPAITVAASTTAQGEPLTITPGPLSLLKKKVAFTGRDILPPKEGMAAIAPRTPMGWPMFLTVLMAPALVFGCAALIQRIRRPQTNAASRMKAKARQALKVASTHTGQAFLSSLYQALTAAIFAAAGRSGEALTWKEAEAMLLDNNLSEEDAGHAAALLSRIESSKFSGAHLKADQSRELLDQTRKMVRKLAP